MSSSRQGGQSITFGKNLVNAKIASKAQGPASANQQSLEVSRDVVNEVRKRGLSESWKLVRLLYSKAVYEPSEITVQEYFVLDAVVERLLNNHQSSWNERYAKTLLRVSNNIRLVRSSMEGSQSASNGLKLILNNFEYGFLLSARAYFGLKKFFKIKDWLVRRNRRLLTPPPPPRYIGVGYRDQGTCSNNAIDGSQAWQEIASSNQLKHGVDTVGLAELPYLTTYSSFLQKIVFRKSLREV